METHHRVVITKYNPRQQARSYLPDETLAALSKRH